VDCLQKNGTEAIYRVSNIRIEKYDSDGMTPGGTSQRLNGIGIEIGYTANDLLATLRDRSLPNL
jgi:hypothetical protein